ncbi:hypothetical protein BGZ93_010679 [Podila epicladia]|nr:hypothetical protein BGZ92_000078 [Podila epicladia]KAG0087917.1 hypothetical protein BGZ93_010679 [Podila epicladia]
MLHRLSIFDIPHIQSSVTANLTYTDLRNCVLVCKTWFRGFNPVLWKEFHSYESNLGCCDATHYRSLFATLDTRRSLLKHCGHIRSLSVRGSNLLRALLNSDCVHLHEIHYAIDRASTGDLGLSYLLELMDQNPYLCALKLTHLGLETQDDEKDFREFVACLKEYPEIQRVQIEFGCGAADVERVLACETLVQLMRFKKTVSVQMKLRLLPYVELSRRRVIVNDPVRRALDEKRAQNEKDRQANEWQRITALVESMDPFVVQDLALDVDFQGQEPTLAMLLLRKCPNLRRLHAWHLANLNASPIQLLINQCVNIQHLDLCVSSKGGGWAEIFRVSKGLVSVRVSGSALNRLSQKALEENHGATLQSISIISYTSELSLPSLLAKCPNLHTLEAPGYFLGVTEVETWDLAMWVHKLETLHLSLNIDNPWLLRDKKAGRIEQARQKICQAIGQLVGLRRLVLGQYSAKKAALRLGHGIEHLVGLAKLESLTLWGGTKQVQERDVQWMVDHWPALTSLESGTHSTPHLPEYVDKETSTIKLKSRTRPWQVEQPITFVTPPQWTECDICGDKFNMCCYSLRHINELHLQEKIDMYEDEFMPSL